MQDFTSDKIRKIRDTITHSFNDIRFIEKTHEYFVMNDETKEEEKYTPVSYVIEKFNVPFDKENIAERTALKNGKDKKTILKEWKYTNLCSTIGGTRTHLYGEGLTWLKCGINEKIPNELNPQLVNEENWLIPTSPKEMAIKKFYDELPNSIYPIGAEFMMSSKFANLKTKMCGTADLLLYYENETDESKSGVILSDWKTNLKLNNNYNRNNNICMKPPFDFMIDEPLSHYTLQFGCYQIMLESIGIPIIGRRLIWIQDYEYTVFKINDVTNILKEIL